MHHNLCCNKNFCKMFNFVLNINSQCMCINCSENCQSTDACIQLAEISFIGWCFLYIFFFKFHWNVSLVHQLQVKRLKKSIIHLLENISQGFLFTSSDTITTHKKQFISFFVWCRLHFYAFYQISSILKGNKRSERRKTQKSL